MFSRCTVQCTVYLHTPGLHGKNKIDLAQCSLPAQSALELHSSKKHHEPTVEVMKKAASASAIVASLLTDEQIN